MIPSFYLYVQQLVATPAAPNTFLQQNQELISVVILYTKGFVWCRHCEKLQGGGQRDCVHGDIPGGRLTRISRPLTQDNQGAP
jgi:hypothetical protein